MARCIALLTDFGVADSYVGVMKGVIYSIVPDAHIVDVSHAIAPQNIRQAAFMLLTSYRYFPPNTIFVTVVDPGVGSSRRGLAVVADGYTFIAPDNGVLSYVLSEAQHVECYEIQNTAFMLNNVSASFHGRDVFAPTAAHLAAGEAVSLVGAQLADVVRLATPTLKSVEKRLIGEVVHIDHFGNVVTSIGQLVRMDSSTLVLNARFNSDAIEIRYIDAVSARICVGDLPYLRGFARVFSDAPHGELLAMIGSTGFLEIALRDGHAAEKLGVCIGDLVEINLK